MTDVNYYACCLDDEADGSIIAPVGSPPPDRERVGAIIAANRPAPIRIEANAFHEAGHAMAALAFGGEAGPVTIDIQPMAMTRTPGFEEKIAVYIAGMVGQNWRDRRIVRPLDDALMPILKRVDACRGGSCDDCRALRFCTLLAPADDQIGSLAAYRRIEAATIELMTKREIAAAVTELAALLMDIGTVEEADIMAIASRHFTPGSYDISSGAIALAPIVDQFRQADTAAATDRAHAATMTALSASEALLAAALADLDDAVASAIPDAVAEAERNVAVARASFAALADAALAIQQQREAEMTLRNRRIIAN